MWNSPKQPIPRQNVDQEYMSILDDAVKNCEQDFDVRSIKVYEALDYFQAKSSRTWGFTLFRQGLEQWNVKALHDGLGLIKQHLGKHR